MNPYQERQILEAEPLELTLLLYRRAIACIKEARKHLEGGRVAERSKAITNAYAAIEELNAALRPEAEPELAARLAALYHYVQQRLIEGNFQQRDHPLADALGILSTLMEAWSGIAQAGPSQATVASLTARA